MLLKLLSLIAMVCKLKTFILTHIQYRAREQIRAPLLSKCTFEGFNIKKFEQILYQTLSRGIYCVSIQSASHVKWIHSHARTHAQGGARKAILHLHAKGQIPPWPPPETLTLSVCLLFVRVFCPSPKAICAGIRAKCSAKYSSFHMYNFNALKHAT
jgi:hypothetical protein